MDQREEVSEIFVNRKKRNKRKTFLIIFFAVIFVSVLLFLSFKFLLTYSGCDVQESKMYSADEIVSSLGIKEKTPLIEINRKELEKKIAEDFPFLTDVDVSISFPKKLSITFTEEIGELSIKLGNDRFFVNKDLFVIKKESKTDKETKRIELLTNDVKSCVVGKELEFFSETIKFSVPEILNSFSDKGMINNVDEVDIRDQFNIRVKYMSRFDVLLGESGDISYKLDLLDKLVSELESNIIAQIDVSDSGTAYVRVTSKIEE